ncbi:unannotated protein [freshwater metagenome]|uniref:Unannotated protein n=1 Tax=freshwater metagenome TaxID=449393 RepID=A0A6J7EAH9_9ZZZZ
MRLEQIVDERAHLILDGRRRLRAEVLLQELGNDARIGAEGGVDAAGQLRRRGLGALAELALELARLPLELGLDEVGVGRRLLAVEYARANFDRLQEQSGQLLARLLALGGQPHSRGVGDGQRVDAQAIACQRDAVGMKGSRGFHEVEVAGYARGLTDRRRSCAARRLP